MMAAKDKGLYRGAWSAEAVVGYYRTHRQRTDEVYDSEQVLFEFIRPGMAILDCGCAAGGFRRIINERCGIVKYCGADVAMPLLKAARQAAPEAGLVGIDGYRLPFRDAVFPLVFSFGVLHLNLDWRELLREMWRVCGETMVCDLRLHAETGCADIKRASIGLDYAEHAPGGRLPYVIVKTSEFDDFLQTLCPRPEILASREYEHALSPMAVAPVKSVLMRVIAMRKTGTA